MRGKTMIRKAGLVLALSFALVLMMLLPMSFTFFSSLVISLPGPMRPASFTFLFTFLSI